MKNLLAILFLGLASVSSFAMDKKPAKTCVVCDQVSSLKCSRCKSVYYCSVKHQKENWPSHKTGCVAKENAAPKKQKKTSTPNKNVSASDFGAEVSDADRRVLRGVRAAYALLHINTPSNAYVYSLLAQEGFELDFFEVKEFVAKDLGRALADDTWLFDLYLHEGMDCKKLIKYLYRVAKHKPRGALSVSPATDEEARERSSFLKHLLVKTGDANVACLVDLIVNVGDKENALKAIADPHGVYERYLQLKKAKSVEDNYAGVDVVELSKWLSAQKK